MRSGDFASFMRRGDLMVESPRGELAPGDFGRVFIGETLGERAASTAAANLFFSLVDAGGPFSGVGGVSGRGVEHVLGLSDNVGGV